MRKSSFQRPRSILKNKAALAALIVVVCMLILFALRYGMPDVFMSIAHPLLFLGRQGEAMADSAQDTFSSPHTLRLRIEALEAEQAELLITNETLRSRIKDIEALGDFPVSGRTYMLAGVLAGPPLSPYDTLVVEGGSNDGIQEGARVYGSGGVPVGTVRSVSSRTSRVLLYSSSGVETYGWFGDERMPITFIGKGAGAFSATLPHDSEITIGEFIYLPGPGAIPFGSVGNIHEDPASPQKRIDILPRVSPFSLTWLLIEQEDAP
jgi:cell shape-determining protein MreC